MKTLSPSLEAHLASGTTTLAWCWRITRSDGEVFGFTDHDRPLTLDGTTFESESGLIPSELRDGTDLAVDAQDAEGVLTSDRITETDIFDGLWDNAEVEVWRVNWQDVAQRFLRRRGTLGQIRRGRVAFVAEVRSMAHPLNQPVGRTYMATCDAVLGDARCGVNLESTAFKGAGEITEALAGRTYAASGLGAFEEGWFAFGTLVWTSGANDGRRAEIMRHGLTSGVAKLTLLDAPVLGVEVGDTFDVFSGCDKARWTCSGKFSNIANFRGFPDIPGPESMVRYATRGNGQGGGAL